MKIVEKVLSELSKKMPTHSDLSLQAALKMAQNLAFLSQSPLKIQKCFYSLAIFTTQARF